MLCLSYDSFIGTLLNGLFGTSFDIMNDTRRQQTTKGIRIQYCSRCVLLFFKKMHLVFQREGHECHYHGCRGNRQPRANRQSGFFPSPFLVPILTFSQDFERKAALFTLVSSGILIINLWENQVGLCNGANMGLLTTIFQVNLDVYGKDAQERYMINCYPSHKFTIPLQPVSSHSPLLYHSGL
jgi:protein SEY1